MQILRKRFKYVVFAKPSFTGSPSPLPVSGDLFELVSIYHVNQLIVIFFLNSAEGLLASFVYSSQNDVNDDEVYWWSC